MSRGLLSRRGLQVLALLLVTMYATILLYQAIAPCQWIDEMTNHFDNNRNFIIAHARTIRKKNSSEDIVITPLPTTTTMAAYCTSLDDLFISVKTTRHYHHSRLPVIIDTWFQFARNQLQEEDLIDRSKRRVLTDLFLTEHHAEKSHNKDDPYFQNRTNGHMINTKCSSSHNRRALCCKMSVEFDKFLQSGRKWFCHFDDDNYVNVPRLLKLLDNYNPREDWYLGKPSIPTPLEIIRQSSESAKKSQKVKFWFATGGAGFCISKALALKMTPVAVGGKFISVGDKIRLPDDVTMGYIIEYLLNKQLTIVEQFHSHLEPMKFINKDTLHEQISFSYSRGPKDEWNVLKIDGFDVKDDPKRFLSIHCYLFPYGTNCPRPRQLVK